MNLIFHLFRLKIIRPPQTHLFEDIASTPTDIIKSAIREKPSKEIRKGNDWHIGNIEDVGDNGLFFALGRVTKSIKEKYDEKTGDFIDIEDEQAPYTYVFLDLEHQVCAIAHKPKISQKVTYAARNLAKLLAETEVAKASALTFDIPELHDPSEFVEQVKNAFSIKEFSISFSPPNPWDVEEDYHKPMENLLRASNGSTGSTKINGEQLDNDTIGQLASSAASTGNKASAKIQVEENGPTVSKKLGGNPATLSGAELITEEEKKTFLTKIIEAYKSIRTGGSQ